MKKALTWIVFIAITAGVILAIVLADRGTFYREGTVSEAEAEAALSLLKDSLVQDESKYLDYLKSMPAANGLEDHQALADRGSVTLAYEEMEDWQVTIDEAGFYNLHMTYSMAQGTLSNGTIEVLIDGDLPFDEAQVIDVPVMWRDSTKSFELDSYGDEALPKQVAIYDDLETYFYNNTYLTVEPLKFYLEAGQHTLTLSNQSSNGITIESLTVTAPVDVPDYISYKATHADYLIPEVIEVNAIDYVRKNSSFARLFSYESPTVAPFDPIDKKLNVIIGDAWYDPGKSIDFEVTVPEDGNYRLGLHYQTMKEDFNVFRTLRIDGQIPFAEMMAYGFKDINGSRFGIETVSDGSGKPYEFYLTEGTHTITLTADFEPLSDEVHLLDTVVKHINQFSLDIRKITGKDVDRNRTWKLTEFLPETEAYLTAYDTLLKYVIQTASVHSKEGYSASELSNIQKSLVKIDKMLEDPDELPLYFEDLYTGTGSVNELLSSSMEGLTLQPLTLNSIILHGESMPLKANASWFSETSAAVKKFVTSFTSDKYVVRNDSEVLNVWVNRPITHVDALQKMVDTDFTPTTGIKVKISVMPDANKLVLASAAGQAPDVAMGLLSYMPFDLAIRDAAYDLSSFDDFWTVADRFTPGAFVPYVLEDNVYALPETLEFYSLVYRKDIFNNLGLEVPDTWDDVTELLPELQRYGMNFYHPISGGTSLKWFYQTSPMIMQKGGSIYSDDGLETTIDGKEAVEGLDYLSKLFTMYSLPEQEPLFFNAFRYGTLPIGIADFTTYMQIKNAAPELTGQWSLAPYPAMEDADGDLNRWIIANGRGSVIMGGSKRAEEGWEFLKWWTSEEIQTEYSFTLQSIYGPEYLWLSGNLDAVENSTIDIQDKEVILEQIKWLRDVPRTPGQYMLERGLSDIWNKAVFDSVPTRIAIDRQVISINREIKRKMIEFGYLDEDGNVLVPYTVRDIDWIIEMIETQGGDD